MFNIFDAHLIYLNISLNISGLRVDEKFDANCLIELATSKHEYFKYCEFDLYYFPIRLTFL